MSVNIDRIIALSETVEIDQEVDGYTAFAVAKIINETLKQVGIDFVVDAHATYNDSRNGRIDGVKHVAGEKVRYTEEQVVTYVAKQVAKLAAKHGLRAANDEDEDEALAEQLQTDAEEDEALDDENFGTQAERSAEQ